MKKKIFITTLIIFVLSLLLLTTTVNADNNNDHIYMYHSTSNLYGKMDIPIPSGFKYTVNNGIVSIQDNNNVNLIYIWVPLSLDTSIKDDLIDIYKQAEKENGQQNKKDSYIYQIINSSTESLPKEYQESIRQYGGFYVSEAELSYDSSNNYYNKARGMVNNTVTGTKEGGDYYRGLGTQTLTYEKVKSIAKKVAEDHTSVDSHLMYGTEWDSMLVWIANTNSDYVDSEGNQISTVLTSNSTYVGKYSNNTKLSETSSALETEFFNGIWGLGGNLSELTQETYNGQPVIRGGSFDTTGEHSPIASRDYTNNIQSDSIGFRTALYVKPNLEKTYIEPKQYYYNKEDYEIDNLEHYDYENIDKAEKASVQIHYGESGIVGYPSSPTTSYVWYAQNAGPWIFVDYWEAQIWHEACGPTSIATVASGIGYDWNPSGVVGHMQYDLGLNYTNSYSLETTLNSMGINTWYQDSGNNVETIKNWVINQYFHPVIICVGPGSDCYFTNGGHIMPILDVGTNRDGVYDFYVANPNVDSPSGWISGEKVTSYINYALYCS